MGSEIDEPSRTLKAGIHRVLGGENMIRHQDGSTRYFTVRERAMIQTFPGCLALEKTRSEAMRQIWNAVLASFAQTIGKYIRDCLVELERN